MRDVYFTVMETTEEEREQLKENLFWNGMDFFEETLDDEDYNVLENIESSEDIPDYLVEKCFEGIYFVDEDFWCNC